MVEIEFSYISHLDNEASIWAEFLDEFSAEYGAKIHLRHMSWNTAWLELYGFSTHDKGPQVSSIGNTWVSSLARMNVLRPFKPNELAAIGEAWDFVAPNWESGLLLNDRRVWAIPWTAWLYVICYRKDLLKQIGIDPAEAFETAQDIKSTVSRLVNSTLEMPWLNAQLPGSNRDLLHIAASWVWNAGGDFIDKKTSKVLFNSPDSIDGLKDWLEIYRAVPGPYQKLPMLETFDLFRKGQAAAVLTEIQTANSFIGMQEHPIVSENLGVASMTETPWTGGGSLIIWNHVCNDSQKEHIAVELVKFLTSKKINLYCQRKAGTIPSRMDALHETYPKENPAHEAVMQAATKGRGYYSLPIWRRLEHQLSETMGAILKDALENPSVDSTQILRKHLDPLAGQVNILLGHS